MCESAIPKFESFLQVLQGILRVLHLGIDASCIIVVAGILRITSNDSIHGCYGFVLLTKAEISILNAFIFLGRVFQFYDLSIVCFSQFVLSLFGIDISAACKGICIFWIKNDRHGQVFNSAIHVIAKILEPSPSVVTPSKVRLKCQHFVPFSDSKVWLAHLIIDIGFI